MEPTLSCFGIATWRLRLGDLELIKRPGRLVFLLEIGWSEERALWDRRRKEEEEVKVENQA